MDETDPAVAELVSSARDVRAELVTHLLHSDDAHAARLGRAIREIQRGSPGSSPTNPSDAGCVIDPITHDPAW
ncbi:MULTISPECIES: hypothetical protein [unclassified Streptomyces]|uniref:hypothetical protein n=1 Tax=unclassified Streptomyces TaxID=2593676 RepID=UPI0011A9026D|nr:hypothetical protein [Streptomyces sp. BK340]TVZ79056.1 hypothetical protein FB157_13354 [Streptomyces sp. BK340]